MKKIILLCQINFILLLSNQVLFCQDSDIKTAKKYFDRGMAAIEVAETKEDFDAAIKEFESAKVLAPEWADVYYNLGMVYEKTERYDEAIKNLQHYLKLAPNSEDVQDVETMITKIEYKNEKAIGEQNKYKDLVGVWDRYDSETEEQLNNFTFLYEDKKLIVQTFGGMGQGLISVPVIFNDGKLEFSYLEKQSQYESEVNFNYSIVNPSLMKGTIQVNVLSKKQGFPVPLGPKPPMPMEMRKR